MPTLTKKLREEYRRLFELARIRPEHARAVEKWCDKLLLHAAVYAEAGEPLGIPWFFVAVLHMRESSLDFKRHLHNGDPLDARTVRVPAGRPTEGEPPFTFAQSARDALVYQKLDQWPDWSLPALLYKLEAFNGWGYFNRKLASPYLWSFSEHYTAGKFIKDGVFDPKAVDAQCGAATLLRRLAERQDIRFAGEPGPDSEPLVVRYAAKQPADAVTVAAAIALQEWLATHDGITLKVDGWPGQRTSNAYKLVTGHLLPGDPRG